MNDATLKYCKEFIESNESPHFAILLKGKWGVGKTCFIEELIKKYPDKNNFKKSRIIFYTFILCNPQENNAVDDFLYGSIQMINIERRITQCDILCNIRPPAFNQFQ